MSRLSVLGSRFFWKIYLSYCFVILFVIALIGAGVAYNVQKRLRSNIFSDLRQKLELIEHGVREHFSHDIYSNTQKEIALLGQRSGTRITLITSSGRVLYDTFRDHSAMENHINRPEVQQALKEGVGTGERFSQSVMKNMFYVAKPIIKEQQQIGILRVAIPANLIQQTITEIYAILAQISIIGIVIAFLIGWFLANRVNDPINEMVQVAEDMCKGIYEKKVNSMPNDEVGRLGQLLNRLGDDIHQQIQELERLERVRRDFVANVSHEIKTPLTSIRGYVETLRHGAIQDQSLSDRFLSKIERNAMRLSQLVQDFLSLAKIESEEANVKPTPTDWHPIVTSVISSYEDAVQAKKINVSVVKPPAPLTVLGDKEAMVQVLDNLLTNAIKYTPEGGKVVISLLKNKNLGCLVVKDTGIGIPAKHLGRIFERFYRVDKARSRELGGTGLGLAIVKHLVSAMGGHITVESEVGAGSRFTVELQLT